MNDGEPDFSKYTAEKIERALRNIDREKYPLNYANLLEARQALPPPMDLATGDALRHSALIAAIASGEQSVSAPFTVLLNTVVAAACVAGSAMLAWNFAFHDASAWTFGDLKDWPVLLRQLLAASVIVLLAHNGTMFLPRVRRAVMRDGLLQVQGLFSRDSIALQDIERVRWNDTWQRRRTPYMLIELRVPCRLGSRIYVFPRSRETPRALADLVSKLRHRHDVADPNYCVEDPVDARRGL